MKHPDQGEPAHDDAALLDVVGGDSAPRVFFVVRHRLGLGNAELRAMGVVNFPGRTPGLPDDDPLLPRQA